MARDSLEAFSLALSVVERAPGVLTRLPVCVPLESLNDLREVAYLALDLDGLTPEETTLRICRWLRQHKGRT